MRSYFTPLLLIFLSQIIYAQNSGNTRNFVESLSPSRVMKTTEKIVGDGILSEKVWQEAQVISGFSQKFPTDTLSAQGDTEMMLAYDKNNFYVAVKCYSKGNDWVVSSLKRDFGFIGNDNITLLLDTYSDRTNAFVFGMNTAGVRREALISNGGKDGNLDFSSGWDNKWRGNAKVYDDYWVAEFIIPFNTVRYKEGAKKWRFSAYRSDTQHNEITVWVSIPIEFSLTDLTYMGEIVFDEPLKKTGTNISVIPYVSTNISEDFEDTSIDGATADLGVGGDVKLAVTSGLNLDLTVNPNFSQVEVDRQVTNINRFELFFPERRQFFLENADLFSRFGTGRSRPFFSRRIGITNDIETGEIVQNTILYGARLSGKINDRTRVGLMNMQTASQVDNDLPSFNYTVGVLQKNIGARSNIALLGINKQAIKPQDFGGSFSNYNRIFGFDYNFGTPNNKWNGKLSHQQAITGSDIKDKFSNHFFIERRERKWRAEIFSLYIGAGYDAEVGFVPRKDIWLVSPEGSYFIYPKNKRINKHTLFLDTRFIYKVGNEVDPYVMTDPWTLSDVTLFGEWSMQFQNFSNLTFNFSWDKVLLFNDFDPTRIQEEGVYLEAGTTYSFFRQRVNYRSDARKKIAYEVNLSTGQFFSGERYGLRGKISSRFQPYGSIALTLNYNYLDLKNNFVPANLLLVGPRIDLTFSKKLFFTTFVQFNNQAENLNINARLQWRFAPVSDFFIVYTDNYFTPNLDDLNSIYVRNRALVAKVTYWLNL